MGKDLATEKTSSTSLQSKNDQLKRQLQALNIQKGEIQALADSLRDENTEISNRAQALVEKFRAMQDENDAIKKQMVRDYLYMYVLCSEPE
jgi:uncharacterized coiled-coil DUF342 family protein